MFPGMLGSFWDPAVFSRAFRRAAIRVGVGSIGPHSLRHTAATEMLRQGIHPKVVADRLGHSTTRMTLDVNSHVIPALEADAASKVDAAIRSKFGQHLAAFSGSARSAEGNEKAVQVRGIEVSDGGRERSRTSGLYSVNLVRAPVYQCPSASISAHLTRILPTCESPPLSTTVDRYLSLSVHLSVHR